jgi:hypothetical protein
VFWKKWLKTMKAVFSEVGPTYTVHFSLKAFPKVDLPHPRLSIAALIQVSGFLHPIITSADLPGVATTMICSPFRGVRVQFIDLWIDVPP